MGTDPLILLPRWASSQTGQLLTKAIGIDIAKTFPQTHHRLSNLGRRQDRVLGRMPKRYMSHISSKLPSNYPRMKIFSKLINPSSHCLSRAYSQIAPLQDLLVGQSSVKKNILSVFLKWRQRCEVPKSPEKCLLEEERSLRGKIAELLNWVEETRLTILRHRQAPIKT